ncbi:hypothetical protein Tco_1537615, partial [Tanacetum coccineum]
YAMRALLRARFKDLPTSDMKEILLQRMLEENYDKGHEDHRMAYEALQKSILGDESEKFDADKAEERKKMKSKQNLSKTPPGLPPLPPPPPLPSGASGAFGITGASNSVQDPLPPPLSPTPNLDDQSPDLAAPGSSKTAATTPYTAWTTTTSRFEPSTSSIPEDASAIASSYVPPLENSLLSQTSDIGVFIDWFCKNQGITKLTPEHLEGLAYEVVKAFHPDVIHLQFQMEECHKLLTNQVDDKLLKYNVSRPFLLGGPPEQMVPDLMWIEEECMYDISATYGISHWWFKRQKFYIDRHSAETNRRAIIRTYMRILSVVRIEVFSIYGYDYMKKIVLQRADNQEYTILENDFKDLYLSDFEE